MSNNDSGGLLMGADAVIGEQVHRGNKWVGGLTVAQHEGGFQVAQHSLFTVDAAENPAFLPNSSFPFGWFVNISTPALSYQCVPGASCPLISATPDTGKDREIAKGELTGLSHQASQLWLAQRRLYEKLTEEGNPYFGDYDFDKFLADAQSNGLKAYADLQKGLRQIFNLNATDLSDLASDETQVAQNMDQLAQKEIQLNAYGISQVDSISLVEQRNTVLQSLNTVSAQRESKLNTMLNTRSISATNLASQNSALSGTDTYLMNEKTVNSIFLQTIAIGNNFSSSQLSNLQSIANQCPLSGGESVQRARDMLTLVQDPVFYNDDLLCSAAPRPLEKSGGIVTNLGNTINIFPNPAQDQITIRYDLKNDNGTRLTFVNLYGQLVNEVLLPDRKGQIIVPIQNLASGIYIYTLDGVVSGRIIVNH